MDLRLPFRKLVTNIIFALSIVLGSSFAAQSSENKIVKISAGEWPPFIGQDLENNGFVAEIITEAFASQGYQVQFYFLPWKRAYNDTQQGKYDASAIWMFDEKRTEHFLYSDPVSQEQFVFFHHIDTPFEWKQMDDIKGKHLGGGLGYSYGEELNKLIEQGQVTMSRVNEPKQNLLILAHKRIDLFPEEVHIGKYTLEQQPIGVQQQITYHPTPFLSNSNFLLLPKANNRSDELRKIFNQGLKEWKAKQSTTTSKP
ncbi:substrate-binding periplasmic protein [Vibrio marisflavi]|uniref:Solute-binding protein family 3/N-terminal domain-containing protein n=1 Tax=Vibrio marisflavi CECT 7928 TaxID=634439 RepID=A0ABN8E8B1_9VIBR|nr:transporter substrate-binding domain-containing protein [Vibrio marisflavi]CAH0541489.1 hypothetical protein VMF7928_03591 [Vibrio marisflavi CECT 7928]